MINIIFEDDFKIHSKIVNVILRSLPNWFGIEESIIEYCKAVTSLPMVVIKDDDEYIGFCSIKIHFSVNAEMYVLGILPKYRNQGLGHKMMVYIEDYCRENNVLYMSVKTLSESHSDEGYMATRGFYKSCGFISFEEMKDLWDENNPCLYMIKQIL